MSAGDDHERALEAALLRLGGGGAGEARPDDHLAECSACARDVAALEGGLAVLRSIPPPADRALVARTRRLVRERYERRLEERRRRAGLAASGLLVAFLTALSSAGTWRTLVWAAGSGLALPAEALVVGGLWLWFLPAALAGAAALLLRERRSGLAGDA